MYNIGSLLLGIAAWLLPFLAVGKRHRFVLCCIGSLSCCTGALFLQLLEVNRRVGLSDWSALMDTMRAVVLAAVVMIVVTLFVNGLALFYSGRKT